MDSLSYRNVSFSILQSLGWEKEPLLDQAGGTTYECTRIRGSVILAYNPGNANIGPPRPASFNPLIPNNPQPAPPGTPLAPAPTAAAGNMPGVTEETIRRFLEQPRGQLIVTSAGVPWLTSPGFIRAGVPYPYDCRNGPFTRVNSVQQVPGERLFRIHLEIETYINEYPQPYGTVPPLIVSNRWYAMDDTNWQHLRTRIYQGVCTVRGDILSQQAAPNNGVLDAIRDSFCAFSCPIGFQRDSVKVTITPDGNNAHYTVVDVEQLFNKGANCPAVRVEVADGNWFWAGTAQRAFAQFGGAWRIAADVVAGGAYGVAAASGVLIGGGAEAASQGVRLTYNAAMDAGRAALGNLPKGRKSVVVRCWGDQVTERWRLVNYAMAIATTRLFAVAIPALQTASSEIMVRQDSTNFVEVDYTIEYGLDIVAGLLGGIPAAGFSLAYFTDVVAGNVNPAMVTFRSFTTASPNTSVDGFAHTQARPLHNNPDFYDQSGQKSFRGTRGTSFVQPVDFQSLVTQAIEGFDQSPRTTP